MPSPSSIPRSISDPNISSPSLSSKKLSRLPPSNRSACSGGSSSSFSKFFNWGRRSLGNLIIIPGRKSSESSSRHSDLTEESLEAHNRRQAAITINHSSHVNDKNVDDKNSKCSPYYKGLTDSTLVINRERNLPAGPSSPGRESHATTHATSNSSPLSSLMIIKMQYIWSSCFTHNSTIKGPSSSSSTRTKPTMSLERKEVSVTFTGISSDIDEKPLRERVSEPPQPPPPAPPTLPSKSIVVDDENNKDANVDRVTEREFIWGNKYQPKSLKDFICNRDKAIQLQGLMMNGGCGHFIFEGPPGVGKRTMIWAMLREAFGADRVQVREECKAFDLKGEPIGSIQVNVKESSQHVEVNLSDLKGYEKHVIVELMKETQSRISTKANQSNPEHCRAIILYEADKLSTDALLYIRWLLERYKGYNKVFFCCSDVCKLQPIKMLCTVVQLFQPSNVEIVEVLEFIAKQEGIELPHQLAEKIAANSKNNLRQAIRSFEATRHMGCPLKENHVILTGWEEHIANIAKNMVQEQSPKQLYIIRGKLQNLIEHDVSPDFIFKSLVGELKKHLDEDLQLQIDTLYEEYNRDSGNMFDNEKLLVFARHRHEETGKRINEPMRKTVQHFLRIEEFIAKFMSCYKSSVTNNK